MQDMEIFADIEQSDGIIVRCVPSWNDRDRCYKAMSRSGDETNLDAKLMWMCTLHGVAQRIAEGYVIHMTPPGTTDARTIRDSSLPASKRKVTEQTKRANDREAGRGIWRDAGT
jgi:hypothetical protein